MFDEVVDATLKIAHRNFKIAYRTSLLEIQCNGAAECVMGLLHKETAVQEG